MDGAMELKSKAFLTRLLIVFSGTVLLIALCYFFVDRQVSTWACEHQLDHSSLLHWFTKISHYANMLAAFSLIYFGIKYLWKKGSFTEQAFLTVALSSIFSGVLADSVKPIFGRYWPNTWIKNNPSWLQNKVFGFHFFHEGWTSFPSGHLAIVVAIGTIIWLAFPKWRLISILIVILEVAGLIAMNFHFVSDMIGGAFIGWVVALFTCHYFLTPSKALDTKRKK